MLKKTLLVVLVVLFGFIVYEKFILSEEARIERGIKKAIQAIQKKDLKACLSHVSLRYYDERDLNYFDLKSILTRLFEEFKDFDISTEEFDILIRGTKAATAFVKVRVLITVKERRGYILGSGNESLPIRIDLKKERKGWMVVRVDGVRTYGFNEDLSRSI